MPPTSSAELKDLIKESMREILQENRLFVVQGPQMTSNNANTRSSCRIYRDLVPGRASRGSDARGGHGSMAVEYGGRHGDTISGHAVIQIGVRTGRQRPRPRTDRMALIQLPSPPFSLTPPFPLPSPPFFSSASSLWQGSWAICLTERHWSLTERHWRT